MEAWGGRGPGCGGLGWGRPGGVAAGGCWAHTLASSKACQRFFVFFFVNLFSILSFLNKISCRQTGFKIEVCRVF